MGREAFTQSINQTINSLANQITLMQQALAISVSHTLNTTLYLMNVWLLAESFKVTWQLLQTSHGSFLRRQPISYLFKRRTPLAAVFGRRLQCRLSFAWTITITCTQLLVFDQQVITSFTDYMHSVQQQYNIHKISLKHHCRHYYCRNHKKLTLLSSEHYTTVE